MCWKDSHRSHCSVRHRPLVLTGAPLSNYFRTLLREISLVSHSGSVGLRGINRSMGRSPRRWIACAFLVVTVAAAQQQSSLSIRVVQGDNAINSIRMRRGHDPVVQILDASGEPLRNATVSFLLPSSGASGTFGESGLSLTVQTDERGMAVGRGLVPNRLEGQFRIRATASWRGESASATLTQTNAEAASTSSRSKWIAILAAAGGAAVGGIVLASRGGSDSTPGGSTGVQPPTTGTIVPGSPSFGPPR